MLDSPGQLPWVYLVSPKVITFVLLKHFVIEYKFFGTGDEIVFKFAVVFICCRLPHVERWVGAANHLQAFMTLEVQKVSLLEEVALNPKLGVVRDGVLAGWAR